MAEDMKIIRPDVRDDLRLGRYVAHDPASRGFPIRGEIDTSTWKTKSVRLYDPLPNPNQQIGNCTGCATAMMLNARGNRQRGRVLDMGVATEIYSRATHLDPFQGFWPPDDTGSYGLAAAKAAKAMNLAGEYRWEFRGADGVVQTLMDEREFVVSIGTWWYEGLFERKRGRKGHLVVEPTGRKVGGHQYVARGYDVDTDEVQIRCWWGEYRDVWIARDHLDALLMDNGDAHVQMTL